MHLSMKSLKQFELDSYLATGTVLSGNGSGDIGDTCRVLLLFKFKGQVCRYFPKSHLESVPTLLRLESQATPLGVGVSFVQADGPGFVGALRRGWAAWTM